MKPHPERLGMEYAIPVAPAPAHPFPHLVSNVTVSVPCDDESVAITFLIHTPRGFPVLRRQHLTWTAVRGRGSVTAPRPAKGQPRPWRSCVQDHNSRAPSGHLSGLQLSSRGRVSQGLAGTGPNLGCPDMRAPRVEVRAPRQPGSEDPSVSTSSHHHHHHHHHLHHQLIARPA